MGVQQITQNTKHIMSVFIALHLKIKDGQHAALKEAMKNVIPKMKAKEGCVGVKPLVARDNTSALIMAEFGDAAKFDAAIGAAKGSGKFDELKSKLEAFAEVKVQSYNLGSA